MQLRIVSKEDSFAEVESEGNITLAAVTDGDKLLRDLLGEGVFSGKVMLNIEKSTYLDSSGVGWLILCHKRFREHGGSLVIHSVPPTVMQVLKVLRMDTVFHLAADGAAARALIAGVPS
jgi:anti-anti-sigma factor